MITQEQEAIQRYDHPRRLISNQIIVSVLFFILAAIIIAYTGYALTQAITIYTYLLDGVFLICMGSYALSFLVAYRHHLFFATRITIIATDITIIFASLLWITVFSRPLVPDGSFNAVTFAQFTSLSIPIILAGVLGEQWMVIATTVLMNMAVVLFTYLIPIENMQVLFIVISLGQQWVFSVTIIAFSRLHQRALVDLGQALVRTEQLDILKDQFITNVNHELRTPVMALQSYIEVLRLRYANLSPEQIVFSLEKASHTGHILLSLLNSILDVRQIDQETAEFTPEVVHIKAAFDQARLFINPDEGDINKREIRPDIPDAIQAWGEPVRVQQILTNLLSNACKYSKPGTPIKITATNITDHLKRNKLLGVAETRPMVEIIVRDYGYGIPPEQIPLLFNRFVRLPRDLASTVTGNGLGLYLCRILAESMHGRIWAESTGIEGEGSSFHLLLPSVALPNQSEKDQLHTLAEAHI
jgi:signal transduction histidine kinase